MLGSIYGRCQNKISCINLKNISRPNIKFNNFLETKTKIKMEQKETFSILPKITIWTSLLFTILQFIYGIVPQEYQIKLSIVAGIVISIYELLSSIIPTIKNYSLLDYIISKIRVIIPNKRIDEL